MFSEEMRIRIGLDGRAQIAVEGGRGGQDGNCAEFTGSVKQALGAVEERAFNADYVLKSAAERVPLSRTRARDITTLRQSAASNCRMAAPAEAAASRRTRMVDL